MSELTPTITDDSFEQDALQASTPVVVDFWAPWCGPCKVIAPILEEIAQELEGQVKILKLNVDENSQIASKYNVMNIPTLIMFKSGQEIDRSVGALSKEDLKQKIQKAIEN